MVRIVNAELADGLGNLVNRCCGKSLNPAQSRPAVNRSSFELCGTPGVELLQLLERVPSSVYDEYHQWQFYRLNIKSAIFTSFHSLPNVLFL